MSVAAGRRGRAAEWDWKGYGLYENKGIDGFTMEKLLHNIDDWITTYDPDIVTVLIGINDIGIMINTAVLPNNSRFL